jgi:predicted dehydrogenase
MPNNDTTNRPLGWALIGCGGAGNGHAQWASSTPDVEVRGFCDVQTDSAQRFHKQYGGEYHTTNPERVFADPTVDIVSIATSHSSHAELAVAAFNAQKHLFLEKPMAMTTADCLRIYEAMKSANKKLMIDFSIRFSGAARAIKDRLHPPKVSHGQCMMGRADLSRWRWHPEEGGGPLYDVGVHAVDLLCWIHDAVPVEVYAVGGQITHPDELGSPDIVDTTAATIRFANGSVATFLMSDAGSNTVISKWFFEFFDGEQSAVLYEHFSKVTFGDGETSKPPAIDRMPLFVEAIRNDTEPYVPAQAGILSTLIIEKITASIQTGRPQKIEMPVI